MVFFGVKIYFFRFAVQQNLFFPTSCRNIIFFIQKHYFLRHKVLTEFFFLPISETETKIKSNLPTAIFFPKKTIVKWMFPNEVEKNSNK